MKRLAAVYNGSAPHHRTLHEPKYNRWLSEAIYLPDLPETDLTSFDGLLIPERSHKGMLDAASETVLAYLNGGGTVLVFGGGEHPPKWVPGLNWEHHPTNYWWWLEPNPDNGVRLAEIDHSFFDYLGVEDATWHYHGLLCPPEGAETLITLRDEGALLYIDKVSSGGTLLVSTLDPISHYGSYFMPATERFLDGFLPWVVKELL